MQIACSLPCAIKHAHETQAKKERKKLKEDKESIKTRSQLTEEAQKAFNRFIRERDYYLPCACCGGLPKNDEPLRGGAWDAGHYRSVGSAPHVRFEEDNVHKQLKRCNKENSGNAVEYRLNLIKRIGLERVEAIEADQEPRKFTLDQLRELKAHYNKKYNELKKAREANEG